MPSFLVRVEIHESDGFDYDVLHELLADIGLARNVALSDGNYWLPDGTYQGDFDLNERELAEAVVAEVKKTQEDAGVIVTELSDGAAFFGLIPYPEDH